eukprot:gnl/Chilomastix_cuspidata/2803.p2 GENE.gnl/Chilomastix_cuspidata/2803~~gnl/Chilomastix_cuspidata/2803.p2  ORF type:complete len:582 (+),score=278.42 gnl/Chilomastix_cuspidata/2803:378-2123(+)
MKFAALLSGGKDSVFALHEAARAAHEPVCVAQLVPAQREVEELDSWMFQTVGHSTVKQIAQSMGLPLVTRSIRGGSSMTSMNYKKTDGDEVEDLFQLLKSVRFHFPDVQAVVSGAVLSNYQRIRVESVCARVGLVSLAPLWQRDQATLLREINASVDAIIVKVAGMGLKTAFLGRTLRELEPVLMQNFRRWDTSPIGEGGEFETIAVDAPLFRERLEVEWQRADISRDDEYDPVGHLHVRFRPLVCAPARVIDSDAELYDDAPPAPMREETAPARSFEAGGADLAFVAAQGTGATFDEATRRTLDAIRRAARCHGGLDAIRFLWCDIGDLERFAEFNARYAECLGACALFPSRACFALAHTAAPAARRPVVGLVAALAPAPAENLHVRSISAWAPACIGPYAQLTRLGGGALLSGMIPLDAQTMELVAAAPAECAALVVRHSDAVRECARVPHAISCALVMLADAAAGAPAFPFPTVAVAARMPRGAPLELVPVCLASFEQTERSCAGFCDRFAFSLCEGRASDVPEGSLCVTFGTDVSTRSVRVEQGTLFIDLPVDAVFYGQRPVERATAVMSRAPPAAP